MLTLRIKETIFALSIGVFVALFTVYLPLLLVVPIGVLLGILLLRQGFFRIVFVVFGSLLVFQSSEGFGVVKMGYLAGVGLIVIIAFLNIHKELDKSEYVRVKNTIFAGLAYLLYLIMNIFISAISGNDLLTAVRDISPYLILAITPILAFDFSLTIKTKHIERVLIISGFYATVACIYGWYNRRYVGLDEATSIGFASYIMAYAFFTYCLVNALRGKKALLWSTMCGLILGGLALTGTRTTFIVLPISFLLVALLGKDIKFISKFIRATKVIFFIVIIATLSSGVLLSITDFDREAFLTRLQSTFIIFDNADLDSDLSYQGRLGQTTSAIEAFSKSPIFGAGAGSYLPSYNHFGELVYRLSIDSPLSLLAKQGLVGGVLFLILLWQVWLYSKSKKLTKMSDYYLKGLIICSVITMFIIPVGEDKGFSLALLVFFALAISSNASDKGN